MRSFSPTLEVSPDSSVPDHLRSYSQASPEEQIVLNILRHEVPRCDQHDPHAELPPLPPGAVSTYGLELLCSSRLIQQTAVSRNLTDLISVSPFTRERWLSPSAFHQQFILDRSNRRSHTPAEPQPSAAQKHKSSNLAPPSPADTPGRPGFFLVSQMIRKSFNYFDISSDAVGRD
jgi:hypothetical protein